MDRKGQQSFVEDINRLQAIKCVVVGDRAVGKSHLICAKACGTKYHLRELVQIHTSTVFAVDHYRTSPEVQRRSICTVESVTCSLRLWDTFGNHEKNRQFAYNSADVVIVCFSVANRRTLQHVETHWIPEIYRHAGHVPVILCACQIDMRYLYNDPTYLDLAREASHRRVSAEDIVLPDEGKEMAKKFGMYYYETSVLVQYGIDEVFSNCVRAALITKRRGKILVGRAHLKSVVRPHLQVPHMPPRPAPPKVIPHNNEDLSKSDVTMVGNQEFSDVVFLVQGQEIEAHSIFLIAASFAFQSFLEERFSFDSSKFCSADQSLMCSQETLKNQSFVPMGCNLCSIKNTRLSGTNSTIDQNSEHDTGIDDTASRGSCSCHLSHNSNGLSEDDLLLSRHSARQRSISARQYYEDRLKPVPLVVASSVSTGELADHCDEDDSGLNSKQDSGFLMRTPTISSSCLASVLSLQSTERGRNSGKILIAVDSSIAPMQFQIVLRYLYTGDLPEKEQMSLDQFMDLKRIARLLGLDDMDKQIENILNEEAFLNLELKKRFHAEKVDRLRLLFLNQQYFSDVTIDLDDGSVYGHLALLAARCEVLLTMFTSEFSERSTGRAQFPEVSCDAFLGVMEYLYTAKCPTRCQDWIGLIELSDMFFLKDLLLSAEVIIIKELTTSLEAGINVVDAVLAMLGPAKLHGAKQLADWCKWLLRVDYKDLIEHDAEALGSFDPDLQAELARTRWPPVWYLKEMEIYEKAMLEMNKLRPQQSWLRRSDGEACISPGGCLSFWKRKR